MKIRPALTLVAAVALAGCGAARTDPPVAPSPDLPVPAVGAVVLVRPSADLPLPGAAARAQVDGAIAQLQSDPRNQSALLSLGYAAYQLARETADPTEYARAEEAFTTALVDDPTNLDATLGLGTIALARHDFAHGLELGQQAELLAPRSARVFGILGDGLVELGRYDESLAAVQRMVDLRPDLGSYARVSYQRELHGNLDGAIDAMEQAVLAGGPAVENTEYLRVILGNLWFIAGDLDHAQGAYQASLDADPGYVFAMAGLARVAAARGDLDGSIAHWRQAADRVPFPEFLIGLGETQEAAGHADDATATYQLVRDIEALFAANGVRTDLEMALFEADHGHPAQAVALGRIAYADTPNVKAADALGWALYRAGALDEARTMAESAVRLGSLEPSYAYHLGMIAKAQGDDAAARLWLARSLARNADWSPLHAPLAAAALAELGDGPVASPAPIVTPSPTEVP